MPTLIKRYHTRTGFYQQPEIDGKYTWCSREFIWDCDMNMFVDENGDRLAGIYKKQPDLVSVIDKSQNKRGEIILYEELDLLNERNTAYEEVLCEYTDRKSSTG